MKAWLKRIFYSVYYYNRKVKFGPHVLLNTKNHFEGYSTVGKDCEIATCKIGLGTYISDNSIIKNAIIGRFCSIGSNVQTGLGLHPTEKFVSTHPAFFSNQKQAGFSFTGINTFQEHKYIDTDSLYVVSLGNDVWIGSNVTIMDGLKIGDGAIVAAGAVVTQDVLPYTIVGGVPAKFIRYRFTEQQIKVLQKIKWWDWDFKEIQAKRNLFDDIAVFTAAYS